MKPENAGEEATGTCTRRAFRGGWGQHAWKDQSRSLGGPAGGSSRDQRAVGRHNRRAALWGVGEVHSSEEANYFSFGYPTGVYWEIDWYVRSRLIRHLQRRSQRPYHP